MADKRISQLIERTDIANNDVLPIVASGATTTNKVTVSTLQDWMQDNLDVGVTSVGLSVPSAFTVSGSPVTTSGNITISGAGTTAQYIRGDGSLADFPSSLGGGGASVSYYLNGSVSQGTIGGVAYRELSKSPILGAGTDFTINADGYIASFITDAGDPSLLEIPGGNWNFETYFQASSGGGTPTFYVELYKVSSGGTATLIATSSGSPELIAFGTNTTPYFSSLAVPTTTLALTDRLAIRYYVAHSGRTITLHTENNTLCQIITTFTTGLTALNGLTAQVQNFATGTSGTDFNISSASTTHTFNLPDASASNRGAVTTGTQTIAGIKTFTSTIRADVSVLLAQAGTALPTDLRNISGTGLTSSGSNGFGFNSGNNIYFSGSDKGGGIISFSNTGNQTYTLQNASGTLAFTSDIPTNPVGGTGTTNQIPKFTGASTIGNSNLSDDGSAVTCSTELRVLGALNGTTATLTSTGTHLSLIRSTFNTFTFSVGTASGISGLLIGNNTAGTTPLIINQSGGAATFSSSVTAVQGNFYQSASSGNAIQLRNRNSNQTWGLVVDTDAVDDKNLGFYTGSAYALRLNATSGAATFSSSVTATSFIVGNGQFYRATRSSGSLVTDMIGIPSGTDNVRVLSTGDINFVNGSLTNLLTIANSGAATFSSSVTATQGVFNGSGTNDLLYLDAGVNTDFAFKIVTGANDVLTLRRQHATLGNLDIISYGFNGNVGIGTASPKTITNGLSLTIGDGGTQTQPYLGLARNATGGFFAGINFYDGNNIKSYIQEDADFNLRIGTSNTERMRITSGGALKASTTGSYLSATGTGHELRANKGDGAALVVNNINTSSPYGLAIVYGSTRNNNVDFFIECVDSTATRFIVSSNGNVTNTNGSYGAISDIKLKENIEDATPKLDDLLKVKVRNYNLIGEETKQIGVIAQELEEVFPAMVSESEDFEEVEVPQLDEEGNEVLNEEGEVVTTKERVSKGTTTKSVKYSVFVPMLIKAIQEQQEIINEMRAEIDLLKTK